MHQSIDTKAINSDRIPPVHAQSIALVSKHYLLKVLIQLPRSIDDHAITYLTSYLAFFFILQSILYKESPLNWPLLFGGATIEEKQEIPP